MYLYGWIIIYIRVVMHGFAGQKKFASKHLTGRKFGG